MRQGGKKQPLFRGHVMRAAKRMCAVGHHQIGGRNDHMVTDNLFQRLLADRHVHLLAFNQHPWLHAAVVHHNIEPLFQLPEHDLPLNPDQRSRITHGFYEIVKKILPYPFLRGQPHEFFPVAVKNQLFVLLPGDPEIGWWKVNGDQYVVIYTGTKIGG